MDFKDLDNKKEEKQVKMEELNLPVGTRLQLITLGSQKGEYYSSLIGFEPNQYIFIKMPQKNGFSVRLGIAEHIEVRVFTGISILKFLSSVEYIYQTPRNFVELTYPDRIQVIPLREDFRIDLKIPARIWMINGQKLNKTQKAILLDLSITGTMLESTSYLGEIGDEIGIAFVIQNTITKEDMIINTMTTVRNTREEKTASGDSMFRYGLLFQELRPFYQATLQNFINDHLLRDRKVIF